MGYPRTFSQWKKNWKLFTIMKSNIFVVDCWKFLLFWYLFYLNIRYSFLFSLILGFNLSSCKNRYLVKIHSKIRLTHFHSRASTNLTDFWPIIYCPAHWCSWWTRTVFNCPGPRTRKLSKTMGAAFLWKI